MTKLNNEYILLMCNMSATASEDDMDEHDSSSVLSEIKKLVVTDLINRWSSTTSESATRDATSSDATRGDRIRRRGGRRNDGSQNHHGTRRRGRLVRYYCYDCYYAQSNSCFELINKCYD